MRNYQMRYAYPQTISNSSTILHNTLPPNTTLQSNKIYNKLNMLNPVQRMRAKRRQKSSANCPRLHREFSFAQKTTKTQLLQRLKSLFNSRLTYAFKSIAYTNKHEMSRTTLLLSSQKLHDSIVSQFVDILHKRLLKLGFIHVKSFKKRKSVKLKRSMDDHNWFSQYDRSNTLSVSPFRRNAQIECIMMPSTNIPANKNILNQSIINRKSLLESDKIKKYKQLNKTSCGVIKKEVMNTWMLSGFVDSVQVSRTSSVSGIHRIFR